MNGTLRKKCPYSELFWTLYSIQMWENADRNNSEYGHFSRSGNLYQNTSLLATALKFVQLDQFNDQFNQCNRFKHLFTLCKIPKFHLISWCGNFMERHSFRRILGDSSINQLINSSTLNESQLLHLKSCFSIHSLSYCS